MKKIFAFSPLTNVYGLARTLLALSTFLTILFTDSDVLFRPLGNFQHFGYLKHFLMEINFYSFFFNENIVWAKVISLFILGLVISGWRPRITGLLHWYISCSFALSCIIVDGGDHINTILCFILVPITLLDSRKNHWQTYHPVFDKLSEKYRSITLFAFYTVLKIQVAMIYFQSSTAKFFVKEWANGTAIYYWFYDPSFGAPDWLLPIIKPLLHYSLITVFITWSVLVFELALCIGPLLSEKNRKYLFFLGVAFHFSIFIIHGLASFSLTMYAALLILLWPHDSPIVFKNLKFNK